ncbi:hypothetical protein GPECTOR_13g756 [Gonium pectorale]|uniref:Uncharacterized protein n=1 Tax=Gonium pectorale TaxID=33097 RepID=A0A150GN72_GONPE|nr:hypothetical protein GPECTOR_13g756 [Gonium pectorale]|eukprot:KXZ51269.1 hypothetical protein GPECTOR_13g756 [Gonium pectorale]
MKGKDAHAAAALDKLDLVPARRKPGTAPARVNKTSTALRSFFRNLLGLEKKAPAATVEEEPASASSSSSSL